jgi:hypothetical protein
MNIYKVKHSGKEYIVTSYSVQGALDKLKIPYGQITRAFGPSINKVTGRYYANSTHTTIIWLDKVAEIEGKTLLLTINENTLACKKPASTSIEVMSASIIKGSRFANYNNQAYFVLYNSDEVRLATEDDFEELRVSSKGFINNKEYLHG